MNTIKKSTQIKNSFLFSALVFALLFSFPIDESSASTITGLDKGQAALEMQKCANDGNKPRSHEKNGTYTVKCIENKEKNKIPNCSTAGKYTEDGGELCEEGVADLKAIQSNVKVVEGVQMYGAAAIQLKNAANPPGYTQEDYLRRQESDLKLGTQWTAANTLAYMYNYNKARQADNKVGTAMEGLKDRENKFYTALASAASNDGGQEKAISEALQKVKRIDDIESGNEDPRSSTLLTSDGRQKLKEGMPEDLRDRFKNYGEYEEKIQTARGEAKKVKEKAATARENLKAKALWGTLATAIQSEHVKDIRRARRGLGSVGPPPRTYSPLRPPENPRYRGALGEYAGETGSGYRTPNQAFATVPDDIDGEIIHKGKSPFETAPSRYRTVSPVGAPGGGIGGASPPSLPEKKDMDDNYGGTVQYAGGGASMNGGANGGGGTDTVLQDAIKSMLGKDGEKAEGELEDGTQFFRGGARDIASLRGNMNKQGAEDGRSIFERVRDKYQDVILRGIL